MIEKSKIDKAITDPYYWIEKILDNHKDYYLSKEEIYSMLPVDTENVPLITISSFTNALRNVAHMRHINVVVIRGKIHYGVNDERGR